MMSAKISDLTDDHPTIVDTDTNVSFKELTKDKTTSSQVPVDSNGNNAIKTSQQEAGSIELTDRVINGNDDIDGTKQQYLAGSTEMSDTLNQNDHTINQKLPELNTFETTSTNPNIKVQSYDEKIDTVPSFKKESSIRVFGEDVNLDSNIIATTVIKPSAVLIPESSGTIKRNSSKIVPIVQSQNTIDNEIDINYLSEKLSSNNENLGVDFESTPWLPPSIEKAKEFKLNNLIMNGEGRLFSTHVINAPGLSIGVCSYFLFMKYITIYMIISFIFMLPMLIFCYYSSKVPTQQKDSIGLYQFTLGNIGNSDQTEYYTEIKIFDNIIVTIDTASYIICLCEFIQVILFLLMVRILKRKLDIIELQLSISTCSLTNYSIMIRNLPKDCTKQELVNHFNSLYPLDKQDWRKRFGVLHAKPVTTTLYSNDPIYSNTWIAECIIHKAIGNLLRTFKEQQNVIDKLFRCRALMKVYSPKLLSCHKYRNDAIKYEKAKKLMSKYDERIKLLTISRLTSTKVKIDNLNNILIDQIEDQSNEIKDIEQYFDADVIVAFISFQYNESMVRCLMDNMRYNRFPYKIWNYSLYYPKELMLRGKHILSIKRASEPTEIIWENLEGNFYIKLIRRFRTFIITIFLTIGCFLIILQSTVYKDKFDQLLPNLNYCSSVIPTVYNNQTIRSSSYISSLQWSKSTNSYDSQCNSIYSGSFYATYTIGSTSEPAVNYQFDRCLNTTTSICPVYNSPSYCPCVSTSSSLTCYSKDCTLYGDSNSNCITYSAGTIGSCYCYYQLIDILQSKSLIDLSNKLHQSSTCTNFFINYSTASLLSYIAIFATVVINRVLLYILNYLTKREYYTSIDKQQTSLLYKIFVSTYFNLAILVVIASGKLGSSHATSRKYVSVIHIFQGIYSDFDTDWFSNIGSYFILSFLLQGISYIIISVFVYLMYKPFMRFLIYPYVRKNSSEYVVRQNELNSMELGSSFDPTENQSQLLALLFFGLTYSGGIPLIAPIATFIFLLHFTIEKLLLLKYTIKPLKIGKALSDAIVSILPYSMYIRLAISCWMYSNPSILVTKYNTVISSNNPGFTIQYYKYVLETINIHITDNASSLKYIANRLLVPHVFPLLLLLVALIVFDVSRRVLINLPIYWFLKYIYKKISNCCKRNRQVADIQITLRNQMIDPADLQRINDPLRKEIAGLTDQYYKFVLKNISLRNCCCCIKDKPIDHILSSTEKATGWEIRSIDNHYVKIKKWLTDNHDPISGVQVNKGDVKHTYEIIREHGCSSYIIDNIPTYELAVQGLKQSIQTIMRKHQKIVNESNNNFNNTFNNSSKILNQTSST